MYDIPVFDPDTLSHAPVGDLLDLLIEHGDRVPRILFDVCVATRRAKHSPASRIERITP